MNSPTGFLWVWRGVKLTTLALGLAMASPAMNVGVPWSGAWAQSANPTVASIVAAIASSPNGQLSPSMQASVATYLNSLPANQAALFINSVASTGGTSGGPAGASLTGNIVKAITSLPGLSASTQTSVGTGLGQAAGILAANGFGGSAKSVLSNVPAGGNMAGGLTTGMAQAIAAVPTAGNALATAAAGTPAANSVATATTQAPTLTPPPPLVVNPNQVTPCTQGSCN